MALFQKAAAPLRGEISVPGDKSVSHRAVMLGALAEGTTRITHFLKSADCLSTIDCFRKMGVSIRETSSEVLVEGRGLHGLKKPPALLDAGNSGTTVRLLSGILAGQSFPSVISGDASICTRPMQRIIDPLTAMNARIFSEEGTGTAPLRIYPSDLHAIAYQSPLSSAQVKSCILLAGLYADGMTSVTEPALSRDHTERMLRAFGAGVTTDGKTAYVSPVPALYAADVTVPGDISSAAYFIAAALLVPGSEILLKNVGVNPTRAGMIRVCRSMGADLTLMNQGMAGGEPVADLLVRSSSLHAAEISGDLIPTLIDELPVLAVLAAFAEGTTVIADAADLKAKESNRIDTVTKNLALMGASVQPTSDGMIIEGGKPLHGAPLNSFHDHRIAMSFAVAALAADGTTSVADAECTGISYPSFYEDLKNMMRR